MSGEALGWDPLSVLTPGPTSTPPAPDKSVPTRPQEALPAIPEATSPPSAVKDVLPAVLVELKQLGAGEEGEEQEPKKATVTFVRGQLAWLDRSAAAMMLRTGQSIDRGQLIRAILGAVRAAGVDLADCWSEADIRDRLTRWIHAGMAAEEAADRAQE